jgi:hypothetical protein
VMKAVQKTERSPGLQKTQERSSQRQAELE